MELKKKIGGTSLDTLKTRIAIADLLKSAILGKPLALIGDGEKEETEDEKALRKEKEAIELNEKRAGDAATVVAVAGLLLDADKLLSGENLCIFNTQH
jgi:hypothetical protein